MSQREDPVRGFNFEISLMESSSSIGKAVTSFALSTALDKPAGGFSECSGLEMSLDLQEHQEGGNNGTVLKFPTRMKWGNITLRRGVTSSRELWEWFYGFVEGTGARRDGVITLRNEKHEPHTVWQFQRGLPLRWTGPSMNAGGSEVAVESIEIAHEGLYLMEGASELAAAISSAAGAIGSLF